MVCDFNQPCSEGQGGKFFSSFKRLTDQTFAQMVLLLAPASLEYLMSHKVVNKCSYQIVPTS